MNRRGARGMGHISLAIQREDRGYDVFSQGAINPRLGCCKLLAVKQPAAVDVETFGSHEPAGRVWKKNPKLKIPVENLTRLEAAVRRQTDEAKPYGTLDNNCANFILLALNEATDFNFRNWIIPRLTFRQMKKRLEGSRRKNR